MSRRIIISWSVEFASLTAIAILLSTASAAAKWWAVLPSVLIIGTKITEYRHNRATHINIVQYQLEILLTLLPSDGATVRCTYHRPVHGWFNGRTQLTQSFDYI